MFVFFSVRVHLQQNIFVTSNQSESVGLAPNPDFAEVTAFQQKSIVTTMSYTMKLFGASPTKEMSDGDNLSKGFNDIKV